MLRHSTPFSPGGQVDSDEIKKNGLKDGASKTTESTILPELFTLSNSMRNNLYLCYLSYYYLVG